MKALYVHIPFCDHICAYCDFCKVFYKEDWANDYINALEYEMHDKKIQGDYDTVYLGGGTPSALHLDQLERVFEMLKPLTSHVQEYTIEVNPESMDEEKLDLCLSYGINRLSIGVQSFHDDIIEKIGRYHTGKGAIALIRQAKAKGIEDINVDLMYGLPGQKLEDVLEDIHLVSELGVSHISVYSLILEDHTVLKINHYEPLDDEEDAYWYQDINCCLKKEGFCHYEVSNYYRDKPSLHNLVYWHYEDYEGVGVSAHSLKNHVRYENTRSFTRYVQHHYLQEEVHLDQDEELFEKMMMGLRLTQGINIEEFNTLFEIDFMSRYHDVIVKYEKMNMLVYEDGYLHTTALGMNYLNTILVDFLD